MSLPRLLSVLALLLVVAASPSLVAQPSAPLHPSAGAWRYVGGADQNRARERAIDEAIEEVPRIYRGAVRERLRSRTQPAARLRIGFQNQRVTFDRPGKRVTLSLGGAWRTVSGDRGPERLRSFVDDHGYLRFVGEQEDSRRVLSFHAAADTLTIFVNITSQRLSKAIDYRLTYRRAE